MKRAMKNKKAVTTMMAVLVIMFLAASGMTASPPAAADDTSCIDFEDLSLGAEYHVGDTFTDSGADIEVQSFQWSDGQWYDGGHARVENAGGAGGSGQEMLPGNVNLRFDFGGPCQGLSLLFGASGGNLNIEINGDFRNFGVFDDIDGSTIGGVDVAINDFGSGKGSLTLSGTINQNSFAIGGQELLIDDVCSEIQAGEKPDLIVTDVWSEDSAICYQIRNVGAGVAPAGHYTGLSVSGAIVHQEMADYIGVDLAPGERFEGCFNYEWVCTPPEETIKVCADYVDYIAESDEVNNCREETWKCDSTPPKIVLGPTVSEITTNSAVVSWTTNESSDSAVKYDQAAGKYDVEETASSLVTIHEITLIGLAPSTTYHFVVQSTDSSENTVQSKDMAFETLAASDYEDPVISTVDQTGCAGMTKITAVASDNIGVDKVEFYLEGDLIYTDYSPSSPHFDFVLDTGPYPSGPHDLITKAVDRQGNSVDQLVPITVCHVDPDIFLPSVWFTNPKKWDTVSGNVTVAVNASDDVAVDWVRFYIDGVWKGYALGAPYTWVWNTQKVLNGQRTIMAEVIDTAGNTHSDSIIVTVDNPPLPYPLLELFDLGCTQHDNYFETVFEVHNAGTGNATDFGMRIYHHGFQCVSDPDFRSANNVACNVSAWYSVEQSVSRAEIRYNGTLVPGAFDKITVNVVPILYDSSSFPYVMGSAFEVSYEPDDEGSWEETMSLPLTERVIKASVEDALSVADYLIVTNPENLFLFTGNATDVNNLLSAMAELAMLKNGVLGYFYAPAAVLTSYDQYDAVACGDIDGAYFHHDGTEEIIVADNSDGTVDVYSAKRKRYTFDTGYDLKDYLLCGDVDADGNAEVIVADWESEDRKGWVYVYGLNVVGNAWKWPQECSFNTTRDERDLVACGDVDGDGEAEIIVAEDTTGMADIYNIHSTGAHDTECSNVDIHYAVGDWFTCADVDGDGADEILILGPESGGTLTVYSINACVAVQDYSVSQLYALGVDGLLFGDVDGDNTAEFISVMSSGEAWVEDIPQTGQPWRVQTNYDPGDAMECGDVDGDGKAEIIVAEDKGTLHGWMDIFTCVESHTGDRYRLSELIEKGGAWSSQLTPDWIENGYLLIVGETEIVPAWASYHEVGDAWSRTVDCSDLKYANTGGAVCYPELSIGRIIGYWASDLTIPIKTSIGVCQGLPGYGFDRSDALVVAGRGPGVSDFEDLADDVAGKLQGEFPYVKKLKERPLEKGGGDIATVFKANAIDKDVIFYTDHAGPNSWGHSTIVVGAADFFGSDPVSFGGANPFVFAAACLSGRYIDPNMTIAQAFLKNGAAVYIGATRTTYGPWNEWATKVFFEKWVNHDKTIGLAFKQCKQDIYNGCTGSLSDVLKEINKPQFRFWASAYHLFGDPKYGGSSLSSYTEPMALAETEIQGPLSSLDVVVPDYEVNPVEEEDYVYAEIPGGYMFIVPDKPLVPFYTVTVNYPQGYEVQDVILTDMSGLTIATGLNIPNAVSEVTGEVSVWPTDMSEGPEWWPEHVFDWGVFENADGSTTLAIPMYPFSYNPLTTEVRFYRNFSFDIDYTVSTVEISSLETDKHVYEQGEQVLVDMEINNSAAEVKDVLVDAVIEAESSGEIVGGLLLRTLKGLAGLASFSPYWDTTGFEPGYYYVNVTLKDTAGNVLDRKTEMFRLGVCSGEITSFTAAPESFDIGDEIDISLAFNNIGTVDISGTALVRVQDEAGNIVQQFSHNVTDLAPDDSISFDDSWDTSGAERGTYNINGLVFYDGQAAGLAITATGTAEPSDEEPSGRVCFIATAAYGTPMAEEIEVLREFRDEYLATNPVGQALVDAYYEVSPTIADFITEHPGLKPIVRAGLLPAVVMSAVAVNTSGVEKMAIIALLVFASVGVAVWMTRRRRKGPECN